MPEKKVLTLADWYEERAKRIREAEVEVKRQQSKIVQNWRKRWSEDAAKCVLETVQSLQIQIHNLAQEIDDMNPLRSIQFRLLNLEGVVSQLAREKKK